MPGDKTIFDIDWFSIYDLELKENFGSVLISDGLNVPPSLVKVFPLKQSLPNCRQLHKKLLVSWEVFGPQITFQLSGQVGENEYMSFGISGSETSTQMIGADVVVAYIHGGRGFTTDYNITSLAPVSYLQIKNGKSYFRTHKSGKIENTRHNRLKFIMSLFA